MTEKTLPERMREAADTLEEATKRYFSDGVRKIAIEPEYADWRPINLRYCAETFETEDEQSQAKVRLAASIVDDLNDGATSYARLYKLAELLIDKYDIKAKP